MLKSAFGPIVRLRRGLAYRALCRRSPLDPRMVIFESFVGWKYACNPRALYEQMLADPRFDEFTFVWAFKEPDKYRDLPALERAVVVKYGSREYYRAHAEARYWISNSVVPTRMKVRPGQVYLQTWHGSPLKRLGCDLRPGTGADAKRAVDAKHRWYHAEGRRLSLLLAQSGFASARFASAFDIPASLRGSRVLESGYPRNDFLHTHTSDDVARIRTQLGLPEGKRVLLYAPTWRDDSHEPGVGYTLEPAVDFEELRREFGDTHVVLFRAHYLVADAFDFERYGGFVRNVSDADDINDFFVIADILITDYSSVMFDYANLHRPIILYMYDLESYAKDLRGLYLGLEELPGPVVRTMPELIEAIRAADAPGGDAITKYRHARERFSSLDDGHAGERVLDQLLSSEAGAELRVAAEYIWSSLKGDDLSVFGLLVAHDTLAGFDFRGLSIDIGGTPLPLRCLPEAGIRLPGGRWRVGLYRFRVPLEDLEALSTQTAVRLIHRGADGRWFDRALGFGDLSRLRAARRSRLFRVHGGESMALVRQLGGNNLYVTVRPHKHTDTFASQFKVILARLASLVYRPDVVLLYEKESAGYEESAAAVFEALVDSGHTNVRFILDGASVDKVPERYRSRLVERFSLEHYFLYFCARTFVGTELVSHAIELRTVDQVLLHHLSRGRFTFVFLQHGVMYMVALDSTQRAFFRAGANFPKRSKIVCSSKVEAAHFVELGGFDAKNMYVSGLPKFDRATREPDSDRILIMPTWHPWEANTIRTRPKESLYYRMLSEMYAAVPDDLKARTWVLPHPLFRDELATTELADHIWGDSYDEALRTASLLITDYSSIAYDAFYRGANVVFWWKEKDYCMEQYGGHLMLEADTAFGPVCWEAASLTEAVRRCYLALQDDEYVARYREIVEFHDGHNTDRLIAMMERDNLI